jgi:hypothetical protein
VRGPTCDRSARPSSKTASSPAAHAALPAPRPQPGPGLGNAEPAWAKTGPSFSGRWIKSDGYPSFSLDQNWSQPPPRNPRGPFSSSVSFFTAAAAQRRRPPWPCAGEEIHRRRQIRPALPPPVFSLPPLSTLSCR